MADTLAESMESVPDMHNSPADGECRVSDGLEFIYYDGYWIRYYAPLEDTLSTLR